MVEMFCDRCEKFANLKTHPCFQKLELCPRCFEMVNPKTHTCVHKKPRKVSKK